MANNGAVIIKLSDLVDGQEATCFAALVRKTRGRAKNDKPYVKCLFRDKRATVEAPLWSDNRFLDESARWAEGAGYRLEVRGELSIRYGMQMQILSIRPATDEDEQDGYNFFDLVEEGQFPADDLFRKLSSMIDQRLTDPTLRELVEMVLSEHRAAFQKMPAAQTFHHAYTAGLLEHVWSMTRIACFLTEHYAKYYEKLVPPLNQSIVIAATILHDIGKLRELAYHPVEARYTIEGRLIGHVLMGRDMVRDTARRIAGFPEEMLLRLEHAILAHHGRCEYGAPILPQTLEALLVSHIDDLDAKMNIAARELMRSEAADGFTDKVYALDNRRLYKGLASDAAALDGRPGAH